MRAKMVMMTEGSEKRDQIEGKPDGFELNECNFKFVFMRQNLRTGPADITTFIS